MMTEPLIVHGMELTTDARCLRCDSTEHLIEGDELIVCRPCVDLLGGIAACPDNADSRILAALIERHGDVVEMRRAPDPLMAGSAPLVWDWTAAWPGVEARR